MKYVLINNLKLNKAAGSDNISPELLKQGGRTLKQKLYKLIIMIWNNEQVTQQWNEGIISPVSKKGDRLNCNNYRPITLLNIAYKIFAILLNKRLMENIENKLEDKQMGFHPNRSTVDNIFIVRQFFLEKP
jgi:sorting nexin-29